MTIRFNQLARILFFDNYLKIFLGVKNFKIEAPKITLDKIRDIYYECNESSSYEATPEDIELLRPLIDRGIFVDATNRHADSIAFHQITSNPSPFHPGLNDDEIVKILDIRHEKLLKQTVAIEKPFDYLVKRKVSRREVKSEPFTISEVEKMFAVSYGNVRIDATKRVHKTVGSAGAMYPLSLYYVDLDTQSLYSFDGVNLHKESVLTDESLAFARTVGVFTRLADWAGIMLILADISSVTEKYGPKGYAFTLIEAGEVLQNTTHYVTKLGHDYLPVGSLVDELVIKAVGLDSSTHIHILGVLLK